MTRGSPGVTLPVPSCACRACWDDHARATPGAGALSLLPPEAFMALLGLVIINLSHTPLRLPLASGLGDASGSSEAIPPPAARVGVVGSDGRGSPGRPRGASVRRLRHFCGGAIPRGQQRMKGLAEVEVFSEG